jgi:hypothetical protein
VKLLKAQQKDTVREEQPTYHHVAFANNFAIISSNCCCIIRGASGTKILHNDKPKARTAKL